MPIGCSIAVLAVYKRQVTGQGKGEEFQGKIEILFSSVRLLFGR